MNDDKLEVGDVIYKPFDEDPILTDLLLTKLELNGYVERFEIERKPAWEVKKHHFSFDPTTMTELEVDLAIAEEEHMRFVIRYCEDNEGIVVIDGETHFDAEVFDNARQAWDGE